MELCYLFRSFDGSLHGHLLNVLGPIYTLGRICHVLGHCEVISLGCLPLNACDIQVGGVITYRIIEHIWRAGSVPGAAR